MSDSIIVAPYWSKPFEVICYMRCLSIGVVLGQSREKLFHPIYYASNSLIDAQRNYMIMEQELLMVVYAFENFWAYLLGTIVVVHTNRKTQG